MKCFCHRCGKMFESKTNRITCDPCKEKHFAKLHARVREAKSKPCYGFDEDGVMLVADSQQELSAMLGLPKNGVSEHLCRVRKGKTKVQKYFLLEDDENGNDD